MKRSLLLLLSILGVAVAFSPASLAEKTACSFLPVVLDAPSDRAHYRTELMLTNLNGVPVDLQIWYTAALGGEADGVTSPLRLAAGEQKFVPDAIAFLRTLGVGIGDATAANPKAGTLLVCPSGTPAIPLGVAGRVTSETRPPFAPGKTGVSFQAVPSSQGIASRATVFGLRANAADRSNVSVYNPAEVAVVVRVTAYSGAGDRKEAVVAEKLEVKPYGWTQIDNVMGKAGFDQGWVTIERISDIGVFGAYGVVNDNETNDGSFIEAEPDRIGGAELIFPVLVDTSAYQTELYLANRGGMLGRFQVEFLDSLSGTGAVKVEVNVPVGQQIILPDVFSYFRSELGSSVSLSGGAGTARIRTLGSPMQDIHAGARVLTRSSVGRVGVFAPAMTVPSGDAKSGVIYGLRSDSTVRSSVAVLNAGVAEDGPIQLALRVFDGKSGDPAGPSTVIHLAPGQWAQPSGFFGSARVETGYVWITKISGKAPWSAYGVVNDGSAPGIGTSDGSYLPVVFAAGTELLPEGVWGGPGLGMWVSATGTVIEADCASGHIDGSIALLGGREFVVGGEWVVEGPGPVREPGPPRYPAVYRGLLAHGYLVLEVSVPDLGPKFSLSFKLAPGVEPRIMKCL